MAALKVEWLVGSKGHLLVANLAWLLVELMVGRKAALLVVT